MKFGFIITSALNTRFGVYSTAERLQQTIDTINSIKQRCPDAHITLIEMAGESLQESQQLILQPLVNLLIDFTNEPVVKQIYQNPNWDVVKSSTEMLCFQSTLAILQNHDSCRDIDRYFKVSGRYLLNDDFDLQLYQHSELKDKLVFAKRKKSQFDPAITGGVAEQYMSRCWSFPANQLSNVKKQFTAMRLCMEQIVKDGGYIDIEHLLFLYANKEVILEVNTIGVQGLLGPNGQLVKD